MHWYELAYLVLNLLYCPKRIIFGCTRQSDYAIIN